MEPRLIYAGVFIAQVCVPADWSDSQAAQFADDTHPSPFGAWTPGEHAVTTCNHDSGFSHVTLTLTPAQDCTNHEH